MTEATSNPSMNPLQSGSDAPRPDRRGNARWIAARLVQLALGLILLFAGIDKARDARDVKQVLEFDGFAAHTRHAITGVVLSVEIVVGLMLIIGWGRTVPLWLTLAMLVVYSGQLVYLLARHYNGDCGCWHVMPTKSPWVLQVTGLARNAVMAAGVLFALYVHRHRRTAPQGFSVAPA